VTGRAAAAPGSGRKPRPDDRGLPAGGLGMGRGSDNGRDDNDQAVLHVPGRELSGSAAPRDPPLPDRIEQRHPRPALAALPGAARCSMMPRIQSRSASMRSPIACTMAS
jgi:hypothetical protein